MLEDWKNQRPKSKMFVSLDPGGAQLRQYGGNNNRQLARTKSMVTLFGSRERGPSYGPRVKPAGRLRDQDPKQRFAI